MSKGEYGVAGVQLDLPTGALTEEELFPSTFTVTRQSHARFGEDFRRKQKALLVYIFGGKEMERYEGDKGRRSYLQGRRDEGGKSRAVDAYHKGDVPK